MHRTPPVVSGLRISGPLREKNTIKLLVDLSREHGDTIHFKFLHREAWFFSHPDDIQTILQDRPLSFLRGDSHQTVPIKPILGDGLVTTDGEMWQHQRKVVRPALAQVALGRMDEVMVAAADRMLDRWELRARTGQPIELLQEIQELTLRITCEVLFGYTLEGAELARTRTSLLLAQDIVAEKVFAGLLVPHSVPTPKHLALKREMAWLGGLAERMIAQARERQGESFLQRLLSHTEADAELAITGQQVQDHILTMLVAASENTANTLVCALHVLASHPAVEERLRSEIATVLGGRAPETTDLAALSYADMVIRETLRVYPGAWGLNRRALKEEEIRGCVVPAGAQLIFSAWITHRHPDFWRDPETFDPERFASQRRAALHPFAWWPFGGGPRTCIGRHLAMTQTMLLLTRIVQRTRVRLPAAPLPIVPRMVIRIQGPLWARPEPTPMGAA
ncbi:MAG: cytochrome P450 [Myxococcota bacterium]